MTTSAVFFDTMTVNEFIRFVAHSDAGYVTLHSIGQTFTISDDDRDAAANVRATLGDGPYTADDLISIEPRMAVWVARLTAANDAITRAGR